MANFFFILIFSFLLIIVFASDQSIPAAELQVRTWSARRANSVCAN